MDNRATSPVVGKLLELGLVVLVASLLSALLFGGVVPEYRAATSAELGDRVLASAASQVERAVPPNGTAVRSETRVEVPARIGGTAYRLRADGRRLVLDHPDRGVGGSTPLVLPPSVTRVEGAWESGDRAVVVVTDGPAGLVVRLESR